MLGLSKVTQIVLVWKPNLFQTHFDLLQGKARINLTNKYIFLTNRKYFFDLDDNSKEVEKGQDALELAQQSEASLNNLLDLEDSNEDEALLQWEEKNKAALKASEKSSGQKGGAQGNVDLLGRFDERDLDQKMLSDLMASPIKDLSGNTSCRVFKREYQIKAKLF